MSVVSDGIIKAQQIIAPEQKRVERFRSGYESGQVSWLVKVTGRLVFVR